MELSAAQIQAIENGEAVPIIVGETKCILLREDLTTGESAPRSGGYLPPAR